MRRRIRSVAALPFHRHSLPQVALDAGLVALAYYLSYLLRFDGDVPPLYSDLLERTLPFVVVGSVFVFALFGLYRHWMRYASQRDYLQIAQACVLATLALVGYVAVVQPRLEFTGTRFASVGVPASVLVLYGLLMLVFIGGSRFLVHMLYERPLRGFRARRGARSVLIVGAGDGGRLLLREILRNPDLGYRPVGFIDDDPRKQNARIDRGVSVLGTTKELARVLEDAEPDEVLIAVPSAPGTMRARVVAACRERGVPVRTMPTVFELLQTSGRLLSRQVREVTVEDVLGREPVRMDLDRVGGYLTGRVVLVTGAGGSIGSELCRQIARVGPSRLVLLDHAEDNLFAIRRELVEDRHVLNTVAVLADCKEGERMREVFAEHRPSIVFHAAAYKHVHLMEENPV
jgi:FlaA1/EpsC-like NDP-sugar epimerase